MTFIISVCGTMGSGKTTVVENVAAAMPNCEMLFEDDFNRTTERSLDQINRWWQNGADVSDFDLSAVVEQLQASMPAEETIIDNRAGPSGSTEFEDYSSGDTFWQTPSSVAAVD